MTVTIFSGQTLIFLCLHILLQKPGPEEKCRLNVLLINGFSADLQLKIQQKLCCVKRHSGVLSGHAGGNAPSASLWRKQEIRALAYSEAKPGQRRRRRAQTCGRRSEEGAAEEGRGVLGLRLREQEGERKKRGRGKEICRAESMCSQWPQRPLGVATVHFYQPARRL